MHTIFEQAARPFSPARDPSRFLCLAAAGLGLALAASPAAAVSYRYSTSSNRIYVEDGGTATLTAIKAALPTAPLQLVDPSRKIWLLSANLYVEDGSVLVLHGKDVGGDVDELRLKSENDVPGNFVQITAEYGTLDLEEVKVQSWDSALSMPDKEHQNFGRAFIRVRSFLSGSIARESRMDIVNSDVGYLGYDASESYGLSWKVIGTAPNLYNRVKVLGNIIGSRIHHNYYGVYSYGLKDALWRDNRVERNIQYGFDPHDDSDRLVIENNDINNNGNHGLIASQRCDHLVIRGNLSYANIGNGIMLHRDANFAMIENNQAYDNGDSGIAIFASSRATVRNNVFLRNANAGIRLSTGAADNIIRDNEFGFSGLYGIYLYRGTDEPNPGDDGRNKRNQFIRNHVHDSGVDGLKMAESDATRLTSNRFLTNAGKLRISKAPGTLATANIVTAGTEWAFTGGATAPTDATFVRQKLVRFTQDSNSVLRFTDVARGVFDPDNPVETLVSPGGSILTQEQNDTGGSAVVLLRDLTVQPTAATIAVRPVRWIVGGTEQREWQATSNAAGESVRFVVGGLTPDALYDVSGLAPLGQFRANALGRFGFTDTLGLATPVTYTVLRAAEPPP